MLTPPHSATRACALALVTSAALTACAAPHPPVLKTRVTTPPGAGAAPPQEAHAAGAPTPHGCASLSKLNQQLDTLAQLAARMDPATDAGVRAATRRAYLLHERARCAPDVAPLDLRAVVHVAGDALARAPRDARVADLIYLRGLAHDGLGDEAAAERDLAHTTDHHHDPNTRADARLIRAERRFERDPASAVPLFLEALDAPGRVSAALVRYKLAWSFYRLDRYPEAVEHFARVALDPDAEPPLADEAAQYIAVALAEEDWDGDGAPDAETRDARAARLLAPYPALYAPVLGRTAAALRTLGAQDAELARFQALCARHLNAPCPEPPAP